MRSAAYFHNRVTSSLDPGLCIRATPCGMSSQFFFVRRMLFFDVRCWCISVEEEEAAAAAATDVSRAKRRGRDWGDLECVEDGAELSGLLFLVHSIKSLSKCCERASREFFFHN